MADNSMALNYTMMQIGSENFLGRPIEVDWLYLWLDVTCVKVRKGGLVVSVAALMDDAETDVLAYFYLPKMHRVKLSSINTLEQLNKEVKRRADVVGIFPN